MWQATISTPVPPATTAAIMAVRVSIRMTWPRVLQKMIDADVLVLASPVYFYSIDAQLKAMIDRTVARWLEVKNKEFYYIVTMADEPRQSADTTLGVLPRVRRVRRGCRRKGRYHRQRSL